jgi:hypothetical protein
MTDQRLVKIPDSALIGSKFKGILTSLDETLSRRSNARASYELAPRLHLALRQVEGEVQYHRSANAG